MSGNRITFRTLLQALPALLWMGLIYWFSDHPGEKSGRLTRMILEYLAGFGLDLPEALGSYAAALLRKTAHFTEYFILFLLLRIPLKKFGKGAEIALIICVLYAASDEFHQTFIPGRTGLVTDVLIDSLGAAAAYLFFLIRKKRRERKSLRINP